MADGSRIILALDTPSLEEAMEWVRSVRGLAGFFKVGSELFASNGRRAVDALHNEGARVFLDLKFHDVPATVSRVCRLVARMGVDLFNVHALGGEEMMRKAVETVGEECSKTGMKCPSILAVTVLTSLSQMDLEHLGIIQPLTQVVERLTLLAHRCGIDGVVCSPHEIPVVRNHCGADFLIVTPGIRLPDSPADDQKRKATPSEAVAWGADYIVLGRPVWTSPDPAETLRKILEDQSRLEKV